MKLIFNKGNAGNAELKKVLGFLDRSVVFQSMERFITNATYTVIKILGKETYEIIQGYYESDSEVPEEVELIGALQYSIAIEGYRRYSPTKDVGHTQNGRIMQLDDHQKQPFEWMIDRDDTNMERMYYQSLDQLLEVLEGLASWKSTDQYKKLNSLFVSKTDHFQDYFNINDSRILMLKLQPGLRQCENQAILPRLTKTEFDALKQDPSGKEELLSMVREACVYWSLAWAMRGRLTVTLFPEGVLQRFVSDRMTTQGKKPPLGNEYAWAAQQFANDANEVLIRIEKHLEPEVVLVDGEDVDVDPPYGFDSDDKFIDT